MTRIGRPPRRRIRAALAMALAVPLVALGADATPAGAAPATGPSAHPTGPLRWVTLPTGDRVALLGNPLDTANLRGRVQVAPAAGREHVGFRTYLDRGEVVVLPGDAAPLVAAGTLDRRLFTVSALLRYHYDDASRPDLPLIVDYAGGTGVAPGTARARVAAAAKVTRDLPSAGAQAVRETKTNAGRFWDAVRGDLARRPAAKAATPRVAHVWLDGPVRATLDQSVPQIGAPAAWAAGLTAAGATVAVLDTGIDDSHPDLADAVAAEQDFTGSESGTADKVGHGTHVASIITGSGAASAGRYKGVAPDAKLLVGKVLDDFGFGFDSDIIAGMEWAAGEHARVVNMSFGSPFGADGQDPIELALTRLTSAPGGPLFVVASGNDGPFENIGSPAEVPAALTVGAVDKQNRLADFSSRGPAFDGGIKPEITAPGVDIVAARSKDAQIGDPVGDAYLKLSGTSMATPHVAGAAAILAAEHPDWTADQLKVALIGSAAPQAGQTIDQQGAGRVDVARAVSQQVSAAPGILNEGVARWPHNDDPTLERSVTYRNDADQPITLDLAVDAHHTDGTAAPTGMFTVSAQHVTVPAHGTAAVTLRTNTTGAEPDGRYTGILTATGGTTTVRTPVAIDQEVESYDVALTFRDLSGALTPNYSFRFVDLDNPKAYLPYDPSGQLVARVPKGRYYFEAWVQTTLGDPEDFNFDITNYFEPEYAVSGPGQSVTVDARAGKPVGITSKRQPAEAGGAEVDSLRTTAWGGTGSLWSLGNFEDFEIIPTHTVASPRDQYTFGVLSVLARPDGQGGFADSPYLFHLAYQDTGSVPAANRLVRDIAELRPVRTASTVGAPIPGLTGLREGFVPVRLPSRLDEAYSTGVNWFKSLDELAADGDRVADQFGARQYGPGRVAPAEHWNLPVFGPAFPAGLGFWVARLGDQIAVDIPLFTDQVLDHAGFSNVTSTSTSVFKDGVLLDREEDFPGSAFLDVPPEPGTYRIEATADRTGIAPLSTRVSGVWTFRSAHVDGIDPQESPLAAVRFAPPVDQQGRAPRVPVLAVPLTVQRQENGAFGAVRGLTVEVSYDDGAHWHRVLVTGRGDHRTALVPQPAHTGFVSLRTTANDAAGNSVQETIIRAYALR